MTTPLTLKSRLQAIAEANFVVPADSDPWQLTFMMLHEIGSPDPVLRDDLIYRTLAEWTDTVLTPAQLQTMRTVLLNDTHLHKGLGEINSDSVFTRSFSLLALVLVVYQHRERGVLTPAEVKATLSAVLDYLRRERDWRGYVGEQGWAHAAAHAADLLDELAQCPEIDAEGLHQILDVIHDLMTTGTTAFVFEEDERMAFATLSLIERDLLSTAELEAWIERFARLPRLAYPEEGYQRLNTKNFLRSLYFQALHKQQAVAVQPALLAALHTLSKFK